jgi:hypothetical protein
MLHLTDPLVPAWHASLTAGDVVVFRFPLAERQERSPKARPCLVLDIEDDLFGRNALIAYGTSSPTRANRGDEIALITAADRAAAGVWHLTRFVAARRLWVKLTDPAFCCGRDRDTPILGRIDGPPRTRLAEVLAALPRLHGRILQHNLPFKRRKT